MASLKDIIAKKEEILTNLQWHHKEPGGEKGKHLDFQVLLPLKRSPHPVFNVFLHKSTTIGFNVNFIIVACDIQFFI